MKYIYSMIFVGMFTCCTSNMKEEVGSTTSNMTSVSPKSKVEEIPCKEDSLVKILLNSGVKAFKGGELIPEPNIKFTSGYSDTFSFTNYHFLYKANVIEFVDTVYENSKVYNRNLYLNNMRINCCKIKNNAFDLDSMELQVVYTESEIYAFNNYPQYILVVSHPMNWVGRMTRFSFFQLINSKERIVIEFIREEE